MKEKGASFGRWTASVFAALILGAAALTAAVGAAGAEPAARAAAKAKKRGAKPVPKRALKALGVQAAAVRAAGLAEVRWPATFGGVWLDGKRAVIAFTQPPPEGLRGLRRGFPKPGQLQRVIVDDSLAELEALVRRAIVDRRDQVIGERCENPGTGRVPPPCTPRFPRYDLEIDVERNAVIATVQDLDSATVQQFQARYGSKLIVEQGRIAAPRAAPILRGGMFSISATTYCTMGFSVRWQGLSAEQSNLMLSAAHCGGDDLYAPRFTAAFPSYGYVIYEVHDYPVDAEVHKVHPYFDATKPLVCSYLGCGKPLTVNRVARLGPGVQDVLQGMTTCLYGNVTGFSCGKVASNGYYPGYYDDLLAEPQMIKTLACSQPGDSGGPVYSFFPLKPSLKKPTAQNTFFEQLKDALKGIFQPAKPPAKGLMAQGLIAQGPAGLGCPHPDNYTVFGPIDHIDSAVPIFVNKVYK
jgi:hypothetical protein